MKLRVQRVFLLHMFWWQRACLFGPGLGRSWKKDRPSRWACRVSRVVSQNIQELLISNPRSLFSMHTEVAMAALAKKCGGLVYALCNTGDVDF